MNRYIWIYLLLICVIFACDRNSENEINDKLIGIWWLEDQLCDGSTSLTLGSQLTLNSDGRGEFNADEFNFSNTATRLFLSYDINSQATAYDEVLYDYTVADSSLNLTAVEGSDCNSETLSFLRL